MKKFGWITVFAIAMGLLECAVVVYLRKLYYPEGFAFPLRMADADIALTELLREAATLVMLMAIGWITGRSNYERFAYFLYTFAVWDIFYYIFLWLLIGWPESLMTWDILFLIPLLWTGPVITPVINAITMIILAYILVKKENEGIRNSISRHAWLLLITGSAVTILGYVWEYSLYLFERFSLAEVLSPANSQAVLDYTAMFVPLEFPWLIYLAGEGLIIWGVILVYRKK